MKRKTKNNFSKPQLVIIIAFSAITFMVIILLVIFLLLNLKINQAVIPDTPVHSLPTPVEIISTPLSLPATWTVTPFISQTPKPSSTALFTITPFIFIIEEFTPTNTEVPQDLPTEIPSNGNPAFDQSDPIIESTSTTEIIIPTRTKIMVPTNTPLPKISVTCGVIPSTIPGASNSPLTFWVQFSPNSGGLGFDVSKFEPKIGTGQRGCSGTENSSGYASCTGSSGMLSYGQTVTVKIATSVGNCTTTYSSK